MTAFRRVSASRKATYALIGVQLGWSAEINVQAAVLELAAANVVGQLQSVRRRAL